MQTAPLVCLALLVTGCSSSPSANAPATTPEAAAVGPKSGDLEDAPPESTPKTAALPTPSSEPAAPEQASRTPLAPPKQAEEIDVNYEDCTVLAATYKKVWLRDALEKDAAAKDGKLRETAEANLREAAESAGDNWLKACSRIVGTRMVRRHLVCASRAKTLQRFNDCYDGKGD